MNPQGAVTLNRIEPAGPPQAYKTYGWAMPLRTHWVPATCEQADCEAYRYGWVTTVDTSTELGRRQYDFITHDRERAPSMQKTGQSLFKFTYGPGFRCFNSAAHRVPLERPGIFTVSGGDWRGNPLGTPTVVHRRAEDWVEDFSIHQDRLATAIQKG